MDNNNNNQMPIARQNSERLPNLPNGKHSTQMEPNQNTTIGRSALAEIGLSTINPNNTITVAPLEAAVRPQGIPSITQAPSPCPLWDSQLGFWTDELRGCPPDADLLRRVEEDLREECDLVKSDDHLLDFTAENGRLYCSVLSHSHSATSNFGYLRLIVIGLPTKDNANWETVIRIPLSAPDGHGLIRLVGEAMQASIAPTVKWLALYHELTIDGHEDAMVKLSKAFTPSMP